MVNAFTYRGLSLDEWVARKTEYHSRKKELWEKGVQGQEFTRECRRIRQELGLVK